MSRGTLIVARVSRVVSSDMGTNRFGDLPGSEGVLLDELLASGRAADAFSGGVTRASCIGAAQRSGTKIDPRGLDAVVADFRRERVSWAAPIRSLARGPTSIEDRAR